jgi:hypothetical protein
MSHDNQKKLDNYLTNIYPNHAKEWRDVYMNTSPMTEDDKCIVGVCIEMIYNELGRSHPNIHFVSSPFEAIVKSHNLTPDTIFNVLIKEIKQDIFDFDDEGDDADLIKTIESLSCSLGYNKIGVFNSHYAIFKNPLQVNQVTDNESYNNYVETLISDELYNAALNRLSNSLFWGSYFASTHLYITAAIDHLGYNVERELYDQLNLISKHSSMVFTFENDVFVVDRPCVFEFSDINMTIHNDDSPAMEWNDGSKMYFNYGVVIPKGWLLASQSDENISHSNIGILSIDNSELQTLNRLVGWDRFKKLGVLITKSGDLYGCWDNIRTGEMYMFSCGTVILKEDYTHENYTHLSIVEMTNDEIKRIISKREKTKIEQSKLTYRIKQWFLKLF